MKKIVLAIVGYIRMWSKKEKEMFETAEKEYKAGDLELISDQEFSSKLKAKITTL